MKKKVAIGLAAVALLLTGAILAAGSGRFLLPGGKILTTDPSYTFDVEDPRVLVGWADNVFLGKVADKLGTVYRKGHRTMPWTLYEVTVTDSIKGSLPDKVSVLQEGGYSPEDRNIYLMQGDQLLGPGAEYLFITRFDKASNLHVLVPVYGDIRVRNSSDRELLLEGFTNAVEQQIPFKEPVPERR